MAFSGAVLFFNDFGGLIMIWGKRAFISYFRCRAEVVFSEILVDA